MNHTTSAARIIFQFAAAVPFLILNLYLLNSPTNADFTDTYTVDGTLAASAGNWKQEDNLAEEELLNGEKDGAIDSSDEQDVQKEAEKAESEAKKEEPEQEVKSGKGTEGDSPEASGTDVKPEEIVEPQGEQELENGLESEDPIGSETDDMEDLN